MLRRSRGPLVSSNSSQGGRFAKGRLEVSPSSSLSSTSSSSSSSSSSSFSSSSTSSVGSQSRRRDRGAPLGGYRGDSVGRLAPESGEGGSSCSSSSPSSSWRLPVGGPATIGAADRGRDRGVPLGSYGRRRDGRQGVEVGGGMPVPSGPKGPVVQSRETTGAGDGVTVGSTTSHRVACRRFTQC